MQESQHPERSGLPALAEMQAWFGASIAIPLPDAYPGNPLAVSAPALEAEAETLLRGKGGLGGFGRLGIYNQQYWFRLVSVMQADYSGAIHIMGLKAFNEMAVSYLLAHPPSSPMLAELDKDFPAFLEEHFLGLHRKAVLQAVAYERALSRAFDAPDGMTLAKAGLGPDALMSARLRLAPHATALHVDWDFSGYRARCAPDESLEADLGLPEPESVDLMIFRDASLEVLKSPLSPAALALLRGFPGTLAEVFANLEGALASRDQMELEANLGKWFQAWVADGWLCIDMDALDPDT